MSVHEAGVDQNLIRVISQFFQLVVRKAKCPVLRIVRRSVRDEIGLIRQRVQMVLKLAQWHVTPYRNAVTHNVQVRARKIDNLFASYVLDVGVLDVPLTGNGPIEDGSSRWHLMNVQFNVSRQ